MNLLVGKSTGSCVAGTTIGDDQEFGTTTTTEVEIEIHWVTGIETTIVYGTVITNVDGSDAGTSFD